MNFLAPSSQVATTSDTTTRSTSTGTNNGQQPQHQQPQNSGIGPVVTPEFVDALLAQELNQMSFQEREGIHEEIHGVHTLAVEETPEFVSQKLYLLEQTLNAAVTNDRKVAPRMSNINKTAYLEALRLNSQYVRDDQNFRLPFLRAELFDHTKAAIRMLKYLDLIYDLHGSEALLRPMRLSDFSPVDFKMMKEGVFQVLPGRDRTGRRIMGAFDDIPAEYPIQTRIRVALYVLMCVAEDIESQRRGLVAIFFQLSPNTKICTDTQERDFVLRFFEATPLRISAVHVCIPDDSISQMIKNLFLLAIGPERRARSRFHAGSPTECLYAIQSFGIPSLQVPINTNSGKRKVKTHHKWLELRQLKERAIESGMNFDGIECPELKDVLFGRGRPIMRHPGNVMMRNLVEAKLDEYNNAKSKKEKTDIAWSIVREMQNSNCRFLKEGPNGFWIEVSGDVARQKISVGFRDLRKTALDEVGGLLDIGLGTAATSTTNGSGFAPPAEPATSDNSLPSAKRKGGSETAKQRDVNSSTSVFLGLDGRYKKQRCNPFDCGK
mmetsp:Transcript_10957/g.19680  ORF Transcript_10957/g.19680 Transcript_10957/m.19680 type:complete len:550 (-) Transcript_10957:1047-2696(-)